MRWIREHKRASIFIATAIVLLIIFVVSAVLGKTGVGPGKLFMSASEKIQKPASSAGRSVSDSARGIFKYRWVVKENNELKEEIRILKNDFVKEKLKKKELEELRELSKALNYKEITKNYKHVSANIVAMNGFSWLNIFTIDRGSKSQRPLLIEQDAQPRQAGISDSHLQIMAVQHGLFSGGVAPLRSGRVAGPKKRGIRPAPAEQLRMGTLFDDTAVFEKHDLIRPGGQIEIMEIGRAHV